MNFIYDDGGRAVAGYKGKTGDCGIRAAAIASGLPYQQVYEAINLLAKDERPRKGSARSSARSGVMPKTLGRFLAPLGFVWVPTMGIGTGCKVHLADGELPPGRLVVRVSKHYTAVIDGEVRDIFNPQRGPHVTEPDNGRELRPGETRNANGISHIAGRCVYGYWRLQTKLVTSPE